MDIVSAVPKGVVGIILGFVGRVNWTNFVLVCKRWKELAYTSSNVWSSLYLNPSSWSVALSKLNQPRFAGLKELRFSPELAWCAKRKGSKAKLQIFIEVLERFSNSPAYQRTISNVKRINLSHQTKASLVLPKLSTCFPSIEQLNIAQCGPAVLQWVKPNQLSMLRHLNLYNVDNYYQAVHGRGIYFPLLEEAIGVAPLLLKESPLLRAYWMTTNTNEWKDGLWMTSLQRLCLPSTTYVSFDVSLLSELTQLNEVHAIQLIDQPFTPPNADYYSNVRHLIIGADDANVAVFLGEPLNDAPPSTIFLEPGRTWGMDAVMDIVAPNITQLSFTLMGEKHSIEIMGKYKFPMLKVVKKGGIVVAYLNNNTH